MKPTIYITRRLPNELILRLQGHFQIIIWEEEDFRILEQAIENAGDFSSTAYFEG